MGRKGALHHLPGSGAIAHPEVRPGQLVEPLDARAVELPMFLEEPNGLGVVTPAACRVGPAEDGLSVPELGIQGEGFFQMRLSLLDAS